MNKHDKIKFSQEYFNFYLNQELLYRIFFTSRIQYSHNNINVIVNTKLLRGNYCLVRYYYDSEFEYEKQYVIQIYNPKTKRMFETEFTVNDYTPEQLFLKNKILRKIKRHCKYYKIVKEYNLVPVINNSKMYL